MQRVRVTSGDEYGDLTVIGEVRRRRLSHSRRRVLCRCICGNEVEVRLDHLQAGRMSCGRCGLEYRGRRKILSEWAKEAEIPESTLRSRLKVMGLGEALERGRVR